MESWSSRAVSLDPDAERDELAHEQPQGLERPWIDGRLERFQAHRGPARPRSARARVGG
jgi:hypothetical protein